MYAPIAIVAAAAAFMAFVQPVAAENCRTNIAYCGYNLLKRGNYRSEIVASLRAANQPVDDQHINYSLFMCNGPDDVPFRYFCPNCVDGGSGKSDYCL
ncbi:hypothetical protein PG999_009951 [Apiospora kogelbergensis]|uniref:Uncharacterized protein n=1 Tax=Apiospora kogelbergensis TaxID=1337665 RepID=A0AAW0QKV5_9PEZI